MQLLDIERIQGISIDLDDTLWPIGPTIARAEEALLAWFAEHAPMTASLFSNAEAVRDIRNHIAQKRPEIRHDMSAVRREAIRMALYRSGDDPLRANEAFDVFFAARQQVSLYSDAHSGLQRLAARYPIVSCSNGNADVVAAGIGEFFKAQVSAVRAGRGKPHRPIFDLAAAELGVPNAAVLHIGDDIALDVVGAIDAGMQAVWIRRGDTVWPYDNQPVEGFADLHQLADFLGLD
jgi:FMN hydrolase / 5-amino-6-(5-phospho-D-ribitylamino)uracil phosphatase